LSLGLIVAGSNLEISSCYPKVLRDGHEPIAGMIALVGLFAIVAGCVGFRSVGEPITEPRRVRLCLLFEHLLYCAALGGWWLLIERETFFIDTPFGRDILLIQKLLLAGFAAVALLSFAVRATLRPEPAPDHTRARLAVSSSAWQGLAAGFVVIAVLNVVQGQETLRTADGLQVSILSRGFPFPAIQRVEVGGPQEGAPPEGYPRAKILTLNDGTQVRWVEDQITVARYDRPPRQMERGASRVRLSDGTQVDFSGAEIKVSLRGRTPMMLDPGAQRAVFADGMTRRTDHRGIVVDVLVGLALMIHCAACVERIHRGDSWLTLAESHGRRS
jgi:hypothetical protein